MYWSTVCVDMGSHYCVQVPKYQGVKKFALLFLVGSFFVVNIFGT